VTRNRASARKAGTAWESAIVDYLRVSGWPDVERRARTGARDQGDIAGLSPFCIEAKSCARADLAAWVAEAKAEAVNARVPFGVAWAKRKGKASPADGYVVMDGATFADLLLAQRALAQRSNPTSTPAVSGFRAPIPLRKHSRVPSLTQPVFGGVGAASSSASPASPNAHGDSNGPFP